MKIALDYDGTYSADPELFNIFIRVAEQRGHEVCIVTMRHYSDAERVCHIVPCKAYYTARQAKIKFMKDLGHEFDIWIDDMPNFLFDSPAIVWENGEKDAKC